MAFQSNYLYRLMKWGVHVADSSCLLCNQSNESIKHLFFDCQYSSELWTRAMNLCTIQQTPTDWDRSLEWSSKNFRGKSLLSLICRICWSTVIYHLWCERNRRLHGGQSFTTSQLLLKLTRDIQSKLLSLENISSDIVNRKLCYNWGLGDRIFKC